MIVKRPVDKKWRISSPFGEVNDKLRLGRPHKGVDFACPVGTPVVACVDGHIRLQRYHSDGSALGTRLWLYSGPYRFGYAHLDRFENPGDFAAFADNGIAVKEGDVIGYSGNTGHSTGPHLHFEIRELPDDRSIEPEFKEEDNEVAETVQETK